MFDVFAVFPGSAVPDNLGFEEPVYRLGEGVVIRVADTADRWLDARLLTRLGEPTEVQGKAPARGPPYFDYGVACQSRQIGSQPPRR